MKEIKLPPLTEALMKRILRSDKQDPYSRQKLLKDFQEFYEPKKPEEKKSYSQNWKIYYQACKDEKMMFLRILKDAVDYLDIPIKYCGNGRPNADLKDILKALCIQAYCGKSGWTVNGELEIAKALGIIDKVYRKSTLNKYLGKKELIELLDRLFKTIAEPLSAIEDKIAIDGTGISVAYGRKRWIEVREEFQLHNDYKKLVIIVGTKTNIIFCAEVTKGTANESPLFKPLLEQLDYVKAKEISADPAYLSRSNVNYVASKGMIPFILPKKNTRPINRGSLVWGNMIRFFQEYKDLFLMHYHQRSNVESTNSMLKRKFGYHTRAKYEIPQINEILCKIVCLNACVLAEAMLEFKLEIGFMAT